jgi:ADP-dependent NAD(P)H-hydrate dehydratase / NAD(P)H-hydrate epimerase
MKILSAEQIRQADQHTIAKAKISSLELMERAATEFTDWFCRTFDTSHRIRIVCGTGNNGGDGLSIARMLSDRKYEVLAAQVRSSDKLSEDCSANFDRFQSEEPIVLIREEADIPDFEKTDIIIDALFGSGLSRPVEGLYASVIKAANASSALRVSVDIPSGLFCDKHSDSHQTIFKANYTATFQCPKLAFFLPENSAYAGQWITLDIGLDKDFLHSLYSPYHTIEKADIIHKLKHRGKFDHKGDFGKALLIAGSKGKMGAAVLCARACLHSGTGLLTTHIPSSAYIIMQTAVPEAMASLDKDEAHFSKLPDINHYDVVGIGPGLGKEEQTVKAMEELLKKANKPLVIDADGLNILSLHPEMLKLLPANTLLTPHPKEFERLAGSWENDFERLEKQRNFAQKYKVFLILKGGHTSVATPDGDVYFNMTGNPGMATGGTGDVLTGMLTGILGQKYSPQNAALIGVYLHGLAGDLAAKNKSQIAMLASDLVDHIGAAVLKLY